METFRICSYFRVHAKEKNDSRSTQCFICVLFNRIAANYMWLFEHMNMVSVTD